MRLPGKTLEQSQDISDVVSPRALQALFVALQVALLAPKTTPSELNFFVWGNLFLRHAYVSPFSLHFEDKMPSLASQVIATSMMVTAVGVSTMMSGLRRLPSGFV